MERAGHGSLVTHVAGVVATVNAVVNRRGEAVVLVGHRYAGSVITGAADLVPRHVRALVYLDAFVPDNGDSCWSMTNDAQRRWYVDGAGRTGLAVDPLPFFGPRARPHPQATLMRRSTLTGAWRTVPTKTHVAATGWPQGSSPFAETTARVSADPTWRVHRWDTTQRPARRSPASARAAARNKPTPVGSVRNRVVALIARGCTGEGFAETR